jgi:excisionase family DNA binding protein
VEEVTDVDLDELRASRSAVVTIADAAAVLGIDARTVSRAMQNGDLPALRVGRRLLIPRLLLLACLGAAESPQAANPTPQNVDVERRQSMPGETNASHPGA